MFEVVFIGIAFPFIFILIFHCSIHFKFAMCSKVAACYFLHTFQLLLCKYSLLDEEQILFTDVSLFLLSVFTGQRLKLLKNGDAASIVYCIYGSLIGRIVEFVVGSLNFPGLATYGNFHFADGSLFLLCSIHWSTITAALERAIVSSDTRSN